MQSFFITDTRGDIVFQADEDLFTAISSTIIFLKLLHDTGTEVTLEFNSEREIDINTLQYKGEIIAIELLDSNYTTLIEITPTQIKTCSPTLSNISFTNDDDSIYSGNFNSSGIFLTESFKKA